MKKIMFMAISVILLVITIIVTPVFAGKPDVPPQGPFKELWDALASLQQQTQAGLVSLQQQLVDGLEVLQGQIEAEAAARITADDALQANINAEEAARIADVDAEETARIAADVALQNQIDNIKIPKLGAWQSKSPNKVYYAATDGFVVAYAWGPKGAALLLRGYTDGSNPPTTVRTQVWDHNPGLSMSVSMTMPVRKGDYWKVESGGFNDGVYWIGFGN